MLIVFTEFVLTTAPIAAFRKRDKHEKDDLGAEKGPQGLPLFFLLLLYIFSLYIFSAYICLSHTNFSVNKTHTLTKLGLQDYTCVSIRTFIPFYSIFMAKNKVKRQFAGSQNVKRVYERDMDFCL